MDGSGWGAVLLGLFGGLAVFLLGLDTLTGALKAQTGDGLRTLIGRLTSNRFSGLATGAGATILLQSSTITTVISIGLVSGGMLTFTQSLGVILGANIGTTFTAQLIAFSTSLLGMAMLFAGFLVSKLARGARLALVGTVLLGLGLVFLGMDVMSDAVRPLRTFEPFLEAMESLTSPLLGILAGAAFTAMVQSSTAATGVAIAMASEGLIPLEAGVAIIIGSNIGTCVTAMLAAIGKPPAALRSALFHVVVNVGGAVVWFFFIDQLVAMAVALGPSYPELSGLEQRAAETPRQFAMAHTIFNVSTALVLVWFLGPIGRLLERLVPDRAASGATAPGSALDRSLLLAPASAVEAARTELTALGTEVHTMVQDSLPAALASTSTGCDELEAREPDVDVRYLALVTYLRELLASGPGAASARQTATFLDVADALEGIGDVVAMNIVPLSRERVDAGVAVPQECHDALVVVHQAVCDDLSRCLAAVLDPAAAPGGSGPAVDEALDEAALRARGLLHGDSADAASYAFVTDLVAQYRRIHDLTRSLARVQVRAGA
jgi:phosphate:Na+ symporter